MLSNVAIQHFISGIIYPAIRVFIIFHHHSSYPFGSNASICRFGSFLQKENSNGTILTFHLPSFTKTGQTDTVFLAGHFYFIIITNCLGTLSKRNTPIHILLGILGSRYRLQHIAQINRACRQNRNIHHAQYLDALNMSFQTGTITMISRILINWIIRLDDAHDLGHHIRSTPRRTTHVFIRFISINFLGGTYLVNQLSIAAYNSGLMNFTSNPLIHISIFYRYHPFLGNTIQRR